MPVMVPIKEFDAHAEYQALSPEARAVYRTVIYDLHSDMMKLGLPDLELRLQLMRRTLSQVLNPERYCG